MDKSVHDERHLEHSASDSGVSFDSIEHWIMQTMEATKLNTNKPKVPSFKITISENKTRQINGNCVSLKNLEPSPCTPATLEEILSDISDTDEDIEEYYYPSNNNIEKGSREEELYDDIDEKESVLTDSNISYLCRRNGQSTGFWNLENIEKLVVTSKNPLFNQAFLVPGDSSDESSDPEISLNVYNTSLTLRNIESSFTKHDVVEKEFDMLSLHPNESWLNFDDEEPSSSNSNCNLILHTRSVQSRLSLPSSSWCNQGNLQRKRKQSGITTSLWEKKFMSSASRHYSSLKSLPITQKVIRPASSTISCNQQSHEEILMGPPPQAITQQVIRPANSTISCNQQSHEKILIGPPPQTIIQQVIQPASSTISCNQQSHEKILMGPPPQAIVQTVIRPASSKISCNQQSHEKILMGSPPQAITQKVIRPASSMISCNQQSHENILMGPPPQLPKGLNFLSNVELQESLPNSPSVMSPASSVQSLNKSPPHENLFLRPPPILPMEVIFNQPPPGQMRMVPFVNPVVLQQNNLIETSCSNQTTNLQIAEEFGLHTNKPTTETEQKTQISTSPKQPPQPQLTLSQVPLQVSPLISSTPKETHTCIKPGPSLLDIPTLPISSRESQTSLQDNVQKSLDFLEHSTPVDQPDLLAKFSSDDSSSSSWYSNVSDESSANRSPSISSLESFVPGKPTQSTPKTNLTPLQQSLMQVVPCEELLPNVDITSYLCKICPYYPNCPVPACTNIHNFEYELFISQNHDSQTKFWKAMIEKYTKKNMKLLSVLIRVYPQSLFESGNESLLLTMIKDILELPIFDHTQSIRLIIFALWKLKGSNSSYEDVILKILAEYEHGCTFHRLCDIILSILVERSNFLRFWPAMEKIFNSLNRGDAQHIDHQVVVKIIEESIAQTPPYLCSLNRIFEKLVSTPLMNSEHVSVELLLLFMKKMRDNMAETSISSGDDVGNDEIQTVIETRSLKDIFMDKTDVDTMSKFFQEHCAPQYLQIIVTRIVNMLKEVDTNEFCGYLKFLEDSFVQCLENNKDKNLRILIMGLVANLLPLLRTRSRVGCTLVPETARLIELFKDDIETFVTTKIYDVPEFIDPKALISYTFKRLVYGSTRLKLALRVLNLDDFQFPTKIDKAEYTKFCKVLRIYFDCLYKAKMFGTCKDVIVLLVHKRNFDVSGLHRENMFDIFDYYKEYINHMLIVWSKGKRDIIIDAEESIFHFFPQLNFNMLRNVLILLYRSEHKHFDKLVEMFDSCNKFYNQTNGSIFCNQQISVPEIWMQIHIFYYKQLCNKCIPKEVHFIYGTCKLTNVAPLKLPGISKRDMELPIQERVKNALRSTDFPLPPIHNFENRITVDMSKKILEHIRRTSPVL